MTIAQLTHMRPSYSFLCQDDDHVLAVSLHASIEAYSAIADANEAWCERLVPLLVETQGPTFYGEALAQEGVVDPGVDDGVAFPAAMRIDRRH
jgi:hypothetical protein